MLCKHFDIKHIQTPQNENIRNSLNKDFSGVVIHNTLGNYFIPWKNCYNIALPAHEWSRYPSPWVQKLNQFDEVWTTTDHVKNLLQKCGLKVPCIKLPPALDSETIPKKTNWDFSENTQFLALGEPHFRKGHHLLMQGFMKAFPKEGKVSLTIKTSPECDWGSPRKDIILIKEKWSRERLLAEYANHDCFISTSLGEGLGLPVCEAIMAELPICTNFWGGHKSLLNLGDFIEIKHEEIIQPFTSDPAFYAEDQKCAYSSPKEIAKSIKVFLNTSISERKKMAFAAKKNFLKSYGKEKTLKSIHSRILEISKK